MITRFLMSVCVLAVAGCATPKAVQYGYIERPMEITGQTASCDDWVFDVYHIPGMTTRVVSFLLADMSDINRDDGRSMPVTMSYSILTDGNVANVQLVRPMWYTTHATYRDLPRSVADALYRSRFKFVGEGEPLPAVQCGYTYNYNLRQNNPEPLNGDG